jgi:hypothetical protein
MNFASDFALVEAEAAPGSMEAAAPASSIAPAAFRSRAAMPSRPPPQRQLAPTTNVIQVRVGAVGEPAPLATGDPTICGHCNGELRLLAARWRVQTTARSCVWGREVHDQGPQPSISTHLSSASLAAPLLQRSCHFSPR